MANINLELLTLGQNRYAILSFVSEYKAELSVSFDQMSTIQHLDNLLDSRNGKDKSIAMSVERMKEFSFPDFLDIKQNKFEGYDALVLIEALRATDVYPKNCLPELHAQFIGDKFSGYSLIPNVYLDNSDTEEAAALILPGVAFRNSPSELHLWYSKSHAADFYPLNDDDEEKMVEFRKAINDCTLPETATFESKKYQGEAAELIVFWYWLNFNRSQQA